MTGGNGDVRDIKELATEASVLRRLAGSFVGGMDMEKVCRAIADAGVEETAALSCSLYMADGDGEKLTLAAARGQEDAHSSFYRDGGGYASFPLGEGICGLVAAQGRAILVDDVTKDARFLARTPEGRGIRSLLAVPLVASERVVGVVNLSHTQAGVFTEQDRELISSLGVHAGVVIESVQLYGQLENAHEELAISEARLREMFARANDALLIIDKTGHIVAANQMWEQFCCGPSEACEAVQVESASGEKLRLKDFLRREAFVSQGVRFEVTLLRPDGPSSVVEISSRAFPVQDDRLCLVIVRDMTEKKALAEQLIRSEKLAAVGEVTAALAHEVNNPLGALYNAVCLLQADLDLSGDNARLMQVAVEEAARLSEIVNHFLSFARFPHARFDWFDVNELVSSALFLMKRDERMGPRVELVMELAENLPECQVDRGQVQEIVFNLVANALDAMGESGRLRIRTYNAKLEGQPAVGLLVEDTGVGMSEEDRGRVFAPFFTTKEVGTGLGLAIVKRIVEEHRGTIAIDSEPGKGCSVSTVLPVRREVAAWHQS